MPDLQQGSIRARLHTASFVTISAVLALVMLVTLATEYVLGRQRLVDDMRVQADLIAAQSSTSIKTGDVAAASETLAALRLSPVVRVAALFDRAGRPIATYRHGDGAVNALSSLDLAGSRFTLDHLDLYQPVMHEGERIGTLHLRAALKPLYLTMLAYTAALMVLGLGALSLGFLVVNRLQQTITQPIVELAAITRGIAEGGDYSVRAPDTALDEIGSLARDFNLMLAQIEIRDRELAHELAERCRAEERLDRLAHFDTVTSLPNRYYFNERLHDAVARANRFGDPVALLFLDLDNFKIVNDTLGHHVGDELLRLVAVRLEQALRSGDMICRIGGDEFAVLLPNVADHEQAARVAVKCLEAVADAVTIEGNEIYVTVSIGISLCPRDATDAADLLKQADTAMYHAKARGRNAYQVFLPEMRGLAQKRLVLETSLRRAIEREEFLLHYQPQVQLATGKVVGVEALVRWQHPELGLVGPLEFIPIAEETGLIVAIGDWVLRTACTQARAWLDRGIGPLRMAVNLSGRQFREDRLVEQVLAILRETGLPPGLLELEITESTLMDAGPTTVERLHQLRAAGVHLAIDDFGTGYSSMNYLKRFPVGMLKVDRSFVRDLPGDADDAAITQAIIAMARSLDIGVTAEGVETQAQADFLAQAGCALTQGYLFARPLPAEELVTLVAERGVGQV